MNGNQLSAQRNWMALAAALVLLASCRSASDGKAAKHITLAVSGQGNLVYAPASLAESLGHYSKENLDVSVVDMAGGSKSLEALLGGSADVVCGFYDHTIQMAAEGRALKAFVVLSTSYAEAIVVSPKTSRKMEKLEDLRGAIIGVTAPGSSTNFFATYVLGQKGIASDEFTVIGTGSGQGRISALEYGKVDAGVLLEPSISYLNLRYPNLKILADTRTPQGSKEVLGASSYPTAVLYSSAQWLQNNPDSARALVRAMTATLRWIKEHSAEDIAKAMPERIKVNDPAAYVEAVRRTKDIFSPDGVMPNDGAEAVLRVMKTLHPKVRDANVDVAQTYTNEFLPK